MHQSLKNPLFSVVIPAYNEELFVGKCLASLEAQDFKGAFEIIVVDNNSFDRTAEVAARHRAKIIFEPKQGVCHARQTGTVAANGEIIVSTDADTVFPKNWLSTIHQAFEKKPEAVAVVGEYSFIEAPWWAKIYTYVVFGGVDKIFRRKGKVVYAGASNFAFRKNYWSGYNTALHQGGDELDLLKQLQAKGPVLFIKGHKVHTSNRRLSKGLFYNLLVTFLFYYLFDYLIGKIAGKSLLGSYPAIRTADYKPAASGFKLAKPAAAIAIFLALFTYSAVHIHKSQAAIRLVKYAGEKFNAIEDKTETKWRHSAASS